MIEKTIVGDVNIEQLLIELLADYNEVATLADPTRIIVYDAGAIESNIDTIIANHDHTVLTDEQQAALVETNSQTHATNIPGWATWDEATALAWHDSNVGDVIDAVPADITGLTQLQLVSVIQALVTTVKALDTENHAMVRMIVALRNKNFPNLQE